MKRIEFAELAGISPAMVTKYADQGLIVFAAPDAVDAAATLEALAGRLNEDKRAAALEKLAAQTRVALARERPPSAARNAKVEIDELKRDTLQLELARRAGELIQVAEVERAVLDAIQSLQAAFDHESRAMADQLTIDLGLSPDRTAILARRLRTLSTRARARFAADMLKLAGEDAPPANESEDAAAAAAPA